MSNKTLVHNNEIDLIYLMKIIWNRKLFIISIILISILIGVVFNYIQRDQSIPKKITFENSYTLYANDNTKFLKFNNINNILTSRNFKEYLIKNDLIFKNFLDRLVNLETSVSFLEKNKYIQKKVSKLSGTNSKKVILDYAKSFNLVKNNNNPNFTLKFEWDNADEGLEILSEYINFVEVILKDNIFSNLDFLLMKSKEIEINADLVKIDYLIEQRELAKEANIVSYKDGDLIRDVDGNNYYLRGTKLINKEIDLIRNRQHRELKILSNEINTLKKISNLDLVKYFHTSSVEKKFTKKNKQKSLIIFIIYGLIIGIIGALILNLLMQKRKTEE